MRGAGEISKFHGSFLDHLSRVVEGKQVTVDSQETAKIVGAARFLDSKGKLKFHIPGLHVSHGIATMPHVKHSIFVRRFVFF